MHVGLHLLAKFMYTIASSCAFCNRRIEQARARERSNDSRVEQHTQTHLCIASSGGARAPALFARADVERYRRERGHAEYH